MSPNPHVDWIKTDPIARVMADHFERAPWRKGDFPTTVSRDGKYIYLASMDTAAPLDRPDYLLRLFTDVYESLRGEVENLNWSCRRAALMETDYLALWEILRDADALPDEYRYPEYHLELIWRGHRPVFHHTPDVADSDAAPGQA